MTCKTSLQLYRYRLAGRIWPAGRSLTMSALDIIIGMNRDAGLETSLGLETCLETQILRSWSRDWVKNSDLDLEATGSWCRSTNCVS